MLCIIVTKDKPAIDFFHWKETCCFSIKMGRICAWNFGISIK